MKIVFFRQLLLDDATRKWTAAQQIVYSHLLSQSILRLDCVFHVEGKNIDFVEVVEEYCDDGKIDLCDYNVQQLSKLLNLSRQKVYDCIEFLKQEQYIQDDSFIYCPKEIIYHGFFELKTESGLSKQLLLFYSWLYKRGQPYGGVIDTFSYKLAELFGTHENNIRTMLSRLSDKGFVKRIKTEDKRYGKLIIK